MRRLLILPVLFVLCSCGNQNKANMGEKTIKKENETITVFPKASNFVDSPLRNRLKLELNAPVSEVWALIGKLERMPEYSSGLQKLDASYNKEGKCIGYTCHFYPMEEGGDITAHKESIKWYEPNAGYASLAQEPNILGLQQSLNFVTLEDKNEKTILQWDVHFIAANEEILKMNLVGFEQALNVDIAQNLIEIFGGEILDNFIENKY